MSDFKIVKLIDPIQIVNIPGGLVPRGAYDNATDYAIGDSVDYLGSSYVMYSNAAAGNLPTDTDFWQILAEKGTNGADGANGQGVPTGGTTGQMLVKNSNTNYDTTWTDPLTGDLSIAYSIALG